MCIFMKKVLFFSIIMAVMTACSSKPLSSGIALSNVDSTVTPQQDFYDFATGGWCKLNPIPDDYARFGTFDQLGLRNMEQVNGLIQDLAAEPHDKGTVEQKIADLYNLAMDTARRNIEGIEPIRASIADIEAINDRAQLGAKLGASMEYGLFGMYVEADIMNSDMNILNECQGGFALGEKEYYIDDDEHTQMIRAEYLKHIAKMFELCGFKDGKSAAETVMRLETRLAIAARNNVELRDPAANYNKVSVAELQAMVPELNWSEFFAAMDIKTDSLSIGQVDHLKEVGKMIAEEPLEDLKTLFIWQVIDGAASSLNDALYNQNFEFFGRILSGKKEPSQLWKRAVGIVNGTLGEAVGQMYVKKYFPEENKKRMLKLVRNLQRSLKERIKAQEWMSRKTKSKAIDKLNSFTVKIGYPDTWRDYSKLDIDPSLSYYENLQRASKFEQDYSLSYLNKPVDRTKWYMNPQTVNAYYNPTTNEICFPAGILQPPFFDMSADDAFNYGAIGVVIGHEMTHGFDDQGSQFDKYGNLNNWWTEEDKAQFEERTKKMEQHFSAIWVAPGVHANGAFTLGENIADHGGLEIAYNAFSKLKNRLPVIDGFTPEQRFFLAYANVWAGNIRPEEILQRTKSDPHSLGRWRVNGALPQIDAWYEAWGITKENCPFYVAPKDRVRVW